jgi:hypothetical protein
MLKIFDAVMHNRVAVLCLVVFFYAIVPFIMYGIGVPFGKAIIICYGTYTIIEILVIKHHINKAMK